MRAIHCTGLFHNFSVFVGAVFPHRRRAVPWRPPTSNILSSSVTGSSSRVAGVTVRHHSLVSRALESHWHHKWARSVGRSMGGPAGVHKAAEISGNTYAARYLAITAGGAVAVGQDGGVKTAGIGWPYAASTVVASGGGGGPGPTVSRRRRRARVVGLGRREMGILWPRNMRPAAISPGTRPRTCGGPA